MATKGVKMKKVLLILGVMMIVFSGCEKLDALMGKNKKTSKSPQMMPPQMVQIQIAKKQNIPLSFTYPARIISDEDVNVRSRISGVLLQKHFQAGQRVKKGDKLYSIDQDVYKARYDVQVANVNVALANLSQAQKEFQRARSLYKKKATSGKNFDNAKARYEIAKANLTQARAIRDSAKIDFAYTSVLAPFDGVIGDGLVNVGEFVSANTPLVRVTKTNPLYAQFHIPDVEGFNIQKNVDDNLWSKVNSDATISYGGKKVDGKLVFIDRVIDAKNGSVKAKAEIQNENNALPVGSFAKITINGISAKNAFKIPTLALQQDLATTFLYVVKDLPKEELEKMPKGLPPYMYPSGIVRMVPIKIDYQTNKFVLVSSGLKNGDKIIMNNFKKIQVGSKIKVVGIYGQASKKVEKK
ncbi:MAG: efflux transporter periplasmic adaptor subunit [Proteobacteria bacterium]|nr:MAG: efflux transporter periplasmic adaptor subunit [Pseudomonadota bacterium]